MKLILPLLAVASLTGCGAMVIETRGFDPATAAKIHEFFDGKRKFCGEGVASEERSLRAQAYNANRDLYYRPVFRDEKELVSSETRQVITCK